MGGQDDVKIGPGVLARFRLAYSRFTIYRADVVVDCPVRRNENTSRRGDESIFRPRMVWLAGCRLTRAGCFSSRFYPKPGDRLVTGRVRSIAHRKFPRMRGKADREGNRASQ